MAGPWEKYASAGQTAPVSAAAPALAVQAPAAAQPISGKPWEKYAGAGSVAGTPDLRESSPSGGFSLFGDKRAPYGIEGLIRGEDGGGPRQSFGTGLMEGAATAANAALFGFGDELEGAISAPLLLATGQVQNLGQGYQAAVRRARADRDRFRRENPGKAVGLDIAGALLGGGALAKQGGKRLIGAFKTAPIRTAAGFGAAEGALYGAGEGEGGIPERVMGGAGGAVKGALAGAAAGKAGQLVFDAVRRIPGVAAALQRAARGEPLNNVENQAMDRLTALLKEKGINPEEALQQAKDAIAAGAPDQMAFDVLGEPGVGLAQGSVLRGTGPAQAGLRAVRARAAGSFERANEIVGNMVSGQNFRKAKTAFADARKEAAKEAFAAAERVRIPPDFYRRELAPFVEGNKEALRKGLRIARAEGSQDAYQQLQNALQGKATVLNSRAMGLFLEGLSDLRSTAYRQGNNNLYRALREGENTFLEKLKEVNPALLKARDMYAGNSRIIDAADFGRDIFSSKYDPEDIADAFQNFTSGEKEAALIGAARAIRDKAVKASALDGNAATRFFRSRDQRERLRALFPDDDSYNRFAAQLDSLMAQGRANVRIDPAVGSATAERLTNKASISGMDVIDTGYDIATGDLGGLGLKALRAVAKRFAPSDTKMQEELAKILFDTPEALRGRLVRYLERQSAGPSAPPPLAQAALTSTGVQLRE